MSKEQGTLTVRTYTASGALPVENAVVRIFGAEDENLDVAFSLITDSNGSTETVTLPAPSKYYSLSPSAAERPYSLYNVEISADGYYRKSINNISVFSGVHSLQLVNMIPLSKNELMGFPKGNVSAVIPEYEMI